MSSGHCHIHLGIVQQSQGNTALTRLAYQTCTYVNDGGRRENYAPYKGEHRGGVVLLPPGANAEFADECNFAMAVGFREKRRDAQAGRFVDFALPREIPERLLLPAAAFVMAPFAAQGMAARIDVERPRASDDDHNPHGHAYIAQRVLEDAGFGNKCRGWNRQFRRDSGRHVRAVIAARITWASALLGIGAFVDPRTNEERGLPPPEERVSHKSWRMNERLAYVAPIENLKAKRRERKLAEAVATKPITTDGPVSIKSAVSSPHAMSDAQRNRRMNFVIQLAQEIGIEAGGSSGDRGEIELMTRDGSMIFDGETFTIPDTAGLAQARLIIELAQALDWPALVVDGNSVSTDEIILAGAPVGMVPINTCAGDDVLLLIKEKFGHLLADGIRPLDPLSAVDSALARANSEEIELAQVLSDKPRGCATEDLSDFEICDIPEPQRPSAADEENSRLTNSHFWEDYLAHQDERLQSIPAHGARGSRPLPMDACQHGHHLMPASPASGHAIFPTRRRNSGYGGE